MTIDMGCIKTYMPSSYFFLDKKVPKNQEDMMLLPTGCHRLAISSGRPLTKQSLLKITIFLRGWNSLIFNPKGIEGE